MIANTDVCKLGVVVEEYMAVDFAKLREVNVFTFPHRLMPNPQPPPDQSP